VDNDHIDVRLTRKQAISFHRELMLATPGARITQRAPILIALSNAIHRSTYRPIWEGIDLVGLEEIRH